MSFIDAHLHLQDSRLAPEMERIVAQMRESGISRWMVNGTSPDDWGEVAAIAAANPEATAGYGLHPWMVNGHGMAGVDKLESFLVEDPCAFVGEIGLDKWIRDHDIDLQKACFLRQMEMANRHGRSTAIHCLQSWGHLRECLRELPPSKPFLLHSFGGPREMIGDFLELGAYFSISGYFFRPDKAGKLSVFDEIPMDRILLETDAPDMLPPDEMISVVLNDGVNHPANLVNLYAAYAAHISRPIDWVIDQIARNFSDWYQAKARSIADERSAME